MNNHGTEKGVALITGAADRLGAVLATHLANHNVHVIIHCNSSTEKADALAEKLNQGHHIARVVSADLTRREARARLIEEAAEHFGPLTLLINNASLYDKDSIETLREEEWDAHFAIHAETPVFLARDFARQLPNNETGHIVNIIDERVLSLAPAAFSYTLSKSVLWAATQTLAQSLAPRIRVNAIGPGPILPEAGQTEEEFRARDKDALLDHYGSPEDVARALQFLIDSPAITGQMIAVDAGEHLQWPRHLRNPTPRR